MVQNVQKFEKCPDYANFSQMVQNGTSLQRWGSPPPNIVVLNYDKLSMTTPGNFYKGENKVFKMRWPCVLDVFSGNY